VDRFQALSTFARVVETGSFVRAAGRLGMSVSAVSRQISELEAHLGVRLLNRTTRRLSLTEAGQAFYERSVQLLADLDEAETALTSQAVVPRGTLRLTCSASFGARHLAPAMAAFADRYREMRFDAELSERVVDLVDEGFDIAVRIGGTGAQNVVARKVGATRIICCAAPAYLKRRGVPKSPEELTVHDCLTYEYLPNRNVWAFRDRRGNERSVRIDGPMHANNGRFLEALAVAGAGIVREPAFIVGPDVRAGRLKPILIDFESEPLTIYVVYPSRRHLSAKVRAFTDFLAERFANEKWGID
jgi:DNA-binding transcriptional LysR family regulator